MIKHTAPTICFVLFALALLMLAPNFNRRAFANPNASVLDYYQKLPAEYFSGVADNPIARTKYVKISDVRNGYLKIEKPYAQQNLAKLSAEERGVVAMENRAERLTSELEIALFKHRQGRHLIAVSYRWSGDCPACAIPRVDFWQDENGKLKNVTEAVLATVDKQMLLTAARRAQLNKVKAATANSEDANENLSDESLTADLVYKLPRTGKMITITTDTESFGAQVKLLDWRWTGSEFVSEASR